MARTHVARMSSFNPCFAGCRPATLQRLCRARPSDRLLVSILVLLDAALRQIYNPSKDKRHPVSILVLLDAALRLLSLSELLIQYSSFNPCFAGCRPATHPRWCPHHQKQVSILVLLDAALRPE